MNYYKRHLGDYAKKTRTLTPLQHGYYNLLLDLYYSEEAAVTSEDAHAVCQARSAKDRGAVDLILNKFFRLEGDRWRNPKADEVIAKYHSRAEKNRDIGSLGGLAKAKRTASESLEECQPNDPPIHKPLTTNQKEEKPRKRDFPCPADWIPEDVWADFVAHRKAKRAHLSDRAVALIVNDLDALRAQGVAPQIVLEYAIKNGHTGLFYKPETRASAPAAFVPRPKHKCVRCEAGCDGIEFKGNRYCGTCYGQLQADSRGADLKKLLEQRSAA